MELTPARARSEFKDALSNHSGLSKSEVSKYMEVLDDIVVWCVAHTPPLSQDLEEYPGRQRRITFRLEGFHSPFCDAYPDKMPKVSVLVDRGGYPAELREQAKSMLADCTGVPLLSNDSRIPEIPFSAIVRAERRDCVK